VLLDSLLTKYVSLGCNLGESNSTFMYVCKI